MNEDNDHSKVIELSHEYHHSHHDYEKHHGGSPMVLSATLHCLTGCAIGEISGMIIGLSLGLNNIKTVLISIILAFIFGYSLSMIPLLKNGINLKKALSLVIVADSLSILSMEIAENIIMMIIPGAMSMGIGEPLFWITMFVSFIVGFSVAYPVNACLLKRGAG